MKIGINQPVGFTEVGQRANNEDSIYPTVANASPENRLFLVCDGVGGQHKGEAASALACESISSFFKMNPVGIADEKYIQAALRLTVENFKVKEAKEKETQGMATTLTLVHFNDAGATIAHLGDSRIYQIRNGEIIFVSEDHKLVNELVRDGHITEQEALTHSQRNVITKVISADRNDVPDVRIITDLAVGDYFFLCSDGVLEQIYDDLLTYHLREADDNDVPDEQKLENIRQECIGKTRDNFSAYLIRVNQVSGGVPGSQKFPDNREKSGPRSKPTDIRIHYENDSATEFTRPAGGHRPDPLFVKSDPERKAKTLRYITASLVIVLSVIAGIWYKKGSVTNTDIKTETVPDTIRQEITATAAPVPVQAAKKTTLVKKEKKIEPSPASAADTVLFSPKYRFYIIRESRKYYIREQDRKENTLIVYDELVSIPGVVHCYRFKNSRINYLFLVKPDLRIQDVDPSEIETGANEIVYLTKGVEHRIDPGTGNPLNPSVKELRKELEEQKQP